MKSSKLEQETRTHAAPPNLSRNSSARRSNDSNSPEFEFWMVRNPSFPQPHLHSADELIVDGFLLPLHFLPRHNDPSDSDDLNAILQTSKPEPGPGAKSSTLLSTSKRWRDIFKMGEKKTSSTEKKKERKSSIGASATAELNINIWPFSRSRSAGNSGNRPKMVSGAAIRKVSSAPCSRSNSAGESKSKKWPTSPGRGGVHLGRSSPVWQVRRTGTCVRSSESVVHRNADRVVRKESLESPRSRSGGSGLSRVRVLNLNVPTCIGYRHHLSCRSDENSTVGSGEQSISGGAGNGGVGGNLFNLRTLFSKKVY